MYHSAPKLRNDHFKCAVRVRPDEVTLFMGLSKVCRGINLKQGSWGTQGHWKPRQEQDLHVPMLLSLQWQHALTQDERHMNA